MKRILILICVMCFFIQSYASAYSLPGSNTDEEELAILLSLMGDDASGRVEMHKAHVLAGPNRYLCADCHNWCALVCRKDGEIYDSGMHGDCEVYYVRSYGTMVCMTCNKVWSDYYSGYHDCYEVHRKCWKGIYDICPCDIS